MEDWKGGELSMGRNSEASSYEIGNSRPDDLAYAGLTLDEAMSYIEGVPSYARGFFSISKVNGVFLVGRSRSGDGSDRNNGQEIRADPPIIKDAEDLEEMKTTENEASKKRIDAARKFLGSAILRGGSLIETISMKLRSQAVSRMSQKDELVESKESWNSTRVFNAAKRFFQRFIR